MRQAKHATNLSQISSARLVPVISEGHVWHKQLVDIFLQSYYPRRQLTGALVSHLPGLQSSPQLVRSAIEAFCLAHVATYTRDETLSHYAQTCHGATLAALNREMGQSVRRHRPGDVILAIFMTVIYPEPAPHVSLEHRAWAAHLRGIVQYTAFCGSSAFEKPTPIDQVMLGSVQESALFLGLAQRKPMGVETLDWFQDKADRSDVELKPLEYHAQRLPAILYDVDRLVGGGLPERELRRVFACIESLRLDLDHWFERVNGSQHPPLQATDDIVCDDDNAVHLIIANGKVFPACYQFSPPLTRRSYATYCMCSLILDATYLHLAYFVPPARAQFPRPPQAVEAAAYEHAANLCRSIHSCTDTSSIAVTKYASLLLELALNFFMELGAVKELGWCQAVQCAIKLRLHELRSSRPPSLCRLSEVIPQIAHAAHFRARRPGKVYR